MISEQYIELVTAYIEGTITSEDRARLNDLINDGEIDILEVKELEQLYKNMGNLPAPKPGSEMGNRFYRMLEQEKKKQESSPTALFKQYLEKIGRLFQPRQLAFALGLLLLGMLIGNWATPFRDYRQQLNRLSSEVSDMRQIMMLTLLDNESVTERLKAVNISTEIQSSDDRIAVALLKTLRNDPNVNVRLAAIEALMQHASNPTVREGLVNAIGEQESPIIQTALADAMLILQEKRSVEKFRRLLDQKDLDRDVRSKLQTTVNALS